MVCAGNCGYVILYKNTIVWGFISIQNYIVIKVFWSNIVLWIVLYLYKII